MSLENPEVVDAIGIENESGYVVLTIADSWPWDDEFNHLSSLQNKLNSYFNFIESGQILESYPSAKGRRIAIDVITRFPPAPSGLALIEKAASAAAELDVLVRHIHYPGQTS